VAHLRELEERWDCRIVYFSQDAIAPQAARNLSHKLKAAGTSLRWASDMRPEPGLTPEYCRELKDGGALSIALGIESGSPRVLELIHKGVSVQDMQTAVKNLAAAGIAVEAMCFTDFPSESAGEAEATLAFIASQRKQISLFICGRFGLSRGARAARFPADYGIAKIWRLDGDELGTGLFYEECVPSKSDLERQKIDQAIDRLSTGWWLHAYPWAGALSTAHTLFWYARCGTDVFRRHADTPRRMAVKHPSPVRSARFDVQRMMRVAAGREAEIWHRLIYEDKAVSSRLYHRYSNAYPPQLPKINKRQPARPRHTAKRPGRS